MSDMPDKIWVDNEPDRKEVMAHKYFSGRALLENMRIPYHHDRIIQAKDAEIARLKSGAKGGWMETALKQADEIAALRKALEGARDALLFYASAYKVDVTISYFPDSREYDRIEDNGQVARESITAIDAVLAPEKGRE
jgi:hypothetical protein